jgi:hypothetical protein
MHAIAVARKSARDSIDVRIRNAGTAQQTAAGQERTAAAKTNPEASIKQVRDRPGPDSYQTATATTNPIIKTTAVAATPMKVIPPPQSLQ